MTREQVIERDQIIDEVCTLAARLATAYHEPSYSWTVAMLRKCYQQAYIAFLNSLQPESRHAQWWVLHYADMALYAFCCQAEGSLYELQEFQEVTRLLNATAGYQITLRQAADAAIARHSLYLRDSLPSAEESRQAVLQALRIES